MLGIEDFFVRSSAGKRVSAMSASRKRTYIFIGLGFGGFMFIANTIWDFYWRTSPSTRTTNYTLDVLANLLIWPLVGYLVGLVCWKLAGESDGEQPTNQR